MKMKTILVFSKYVFSVLFLMGFSLSSYALWDPVEYANYLQNLKTAMNSVTSLANQETQIRQQITMIQDQVKNSTSIPNYQWQNIENLMQQMEATSREKQALSYSLTGLDQRFQTIYSDYSGGDVSSVDYAHTTQQWHQTTLSTLQQSLKSMGMDAAHFQNENATMMELKHQGQTSTGRLQALQVLSEMAAENINQLQAMKRVMMTHANAEIAYQAYRVSKEAYETHALKTLNDHLPTETPQYQNNSDFGLIPSMR